MIERSDPSASNTAGVPPLSSDDLYAFERLADPALHPERDWVAYTVAVADRKRDSYRSTIWLAAEGEEPRQYTAGPGDSTPRWSPDGQWLAFLRQPESAAPQLWVLPVAGGDAAKVDDGPVVAFDWSPTSDAFAVVRLVDLRGEPADEAETTRRQSEPVVIERLGYKADGSGLIGTQRTHLFAVSRTGESATQLTAGDFFVAGPSWSPAGDRIAVLTAVHETRDLDFISSVATVDVRDGTLTVITDWEGLATWAGWLPDGRVLLTGWERVDTALHTGLYAVPATGGKPESVLHNFDRNVMPGGPGYPGAPPRVAGDDIVFCARDEGSVHLFAVSLASGQCRKLLGGAERLITGCSLVGEQIALIVAGPTSPGDLVVRALDGTAERTAVRANRFLDERSVLTAVARTFDIGGAHVHGRILRREWAPTGGPLLLDIHGGPHNAWGPALDDVHLYHQELAAQGWTVLTLNTIGSDGYGQDWYAGLRDGWGVTDEGQFLGAVDILVEEGLADADKIAVTGYSYGGFMTNWLVTRSQRFAAAVTGGCVTNLSSIYGTADVGPLLLTSELGVDLHEAPARYAELSPLSGAPGVTTPTLILHGEADHRCPVGQAEEWFATLRRHEVPVKMVRYPGAGHLFILNGRPSHRLHYNQQLIAWVTDHVT